MQRKNLCNCHPSFLFSTPFLSTRIFGPTAKSSFNELLPKKHENKVGPISLDTRNKVCLTNIFEDVICDACDPCNAMCFILFTVSSIYNIGKQTKKKKKKKEGRWHRRLKTQKREKSTRSIKKSKEKWKRCSIEEIEWCAKWK